MLVLHYTVHTIIRRRQSRRVLVYFSLIVKGLPHKRLPRNLSGPDHLGLGAPGPTRSSGGCA